LLSALYSLALSLSLSVSLCLLFLHSQGASGERAQQGKGEQSISEIRAATRAVQRAEHRAEQSARHRAESWPERTE